MILTQNVIQFFTSSHSERSLHRKFRIDSSLKTLTFLKIPRNFSESRKMPNFLIDCLKLNIFGQFWRFWMLKRHQVIIWENDLLQAFYKQLEYYYLLRIFKNNIYENLSRFKFLNTYRFKTFVLLKFKLDHFGEQVHRFLSNFILLNQTFYAAENLRKRMLNFFVKIQASSDRLRLTPKPVGGLVTTSWLTKIWHYNLWVSLPN